SWSTAATCATGTSKRPARSWASFGPLDIQVKLPEKAFFRSNLPLTEQNGEYRAHFETLPQENLVFGVMSRQGLIGEMADTGPYYLIAFVLFMVLAVGLGWALGYLAGGMRTRGWAIGLAVLLGLVAGGVGDLLLSFGSHLLFGALRNDSYGSVIIVFVQWVPGMLVTTVVAGGKAARRHRARTATAAPVA
ncbi:MAG TPA: hypothetical protein VK464_26190, partial [Symbiobacteriaceae bacterium]|nr:hypothetical protein [Symbiobacteriaceae bacterium]